MADVVDHSSSDAPPPPLRGDGLDELRRLLAGVDPDDAGDEARELHRLLFDPEAPRTDLDELRLLLLGREQAQLGRLAEHIDNPKVLAEDVAGVLPEAVRLRTARDKHFTKAIASSVEEALIASVRQSPQTLADALSPVMGPAIRRSIAQALNELVQALNQALEYSLSPKGLKWRWEAFRTGKSFAEVVLRHTLLFRVEQVFLIHRETGLVLHHAAAAAVAAQDADLVSGMLTAIQDFVHDSFGVGEGDALETLRVGELTVWIERGPRAVLAAVIRGTAPEGFRSTLRDTLDTIHLEHASDLNAFKGDATPFEATRKHLEACLLVQLGRAEDRTGNGLPLPLLVAAAAAAILLGIWLAISWRAERRFSDLVARLNATPGLVVVTTERQGGRWMIRGLRDPLAADPETILRAAGFDPTAMTGRWEPYQSLHPEFTTRRAAQLLQPPKTATVEMKNGVLRVSGIARREWITSMRRLGPMLAGIERIEDADLVDFDALKSPIESLAVRFPAGRTQLPPGQDAMVGQLTVLLRDLDARRRAAGWPVRVEIVGQADSTGPSERNATLSRERAEVVRSLLVSRGVEASLVTTAKFDSSQLGTQRAAVLRVVLE